MPKQTLVILPGWGGSHETWQPFMDIAQGDVDVVCIDLPCFGEEPCPQTVWGVEDYSNFVADKLSNIKTEGSKLTLLGHSFGGAVATRFVASHPGMVDRLILSGAAVYRPKRYLRRLFFGIVAKGGKWLFKLPVIERFDLFAKKLLYRGAHSPDYGNTSGMKRDIFKKIIRQDQGKFLKQITIPTYVIWGDKDTYVPLRDGKRMAKVLPNATLQVVEGGKHGMHIQDPQKLWNNVHTFLNT